MNAVSTPLARLRTIELSPTAFRRLSLAAVAMLYAIVSTGATVRLTGSGLGCEHWPGCQAGNPFPATGYHSYIEFGNRMVASVTIAVTLLAWLGARRTPLLPRWVLRTTLAIFVGTLAQAPLGAITVAYHLHPLLVMPHLLLSMALLAAAIVVALEALRVERGRRDAIVPLELQRLGLVVAAACYALVVTGTLATAAGPHSGGRHVARIGTLTVALVTHAVAVAVFGGGLLLLLGYLAAHRARAGRELRLAVGLAVLLAAQMIVGEIQYRTQLPWGVVLVHVALAAAVWGWTVSLVVILRRPLAD